MDGFRRRLGSDDVADLRPVSAGLQSYYTRGTLNEQGVNRRSTAIAPLALPGRSFKFQRPAKALLSADR